MYKLVILPDAKSDIKKAARWYSEKQQIIISAVFHTSPNPENWENRK